MKAGVVSFLFLMCLAASASGQWEHLAFPTSDPISIIQVNGTLYGAGATDYYKSTDLGKTWSLFNTGLPENSLLRGSGLYYDNGKIYLRQSSNVDNTVNPDLQGAYYYCNPGDDHWSVRFIKAINGSFPDRSQVFFLGTDTAVSYVEGTDSMQGFYVSSNGGKNWKRQKYDKSQFLVADPLHIGRRIIVQYGIADSTHLLIPGYLSYSDDLGVSWIKGEVPQSWLVGSPRPYLNAIGDHILFAGLYGGEGKERYISLNGGATWEQFNFHNGDSTKDIYFYNGLSSDDVINLSFITYEASGIKYLHYYSSNKGHDWQAIPFADSTSGNCKMYGYNNAITIQQHNTLLFTDTTYTDVLKATLSSAKNQNMNIAAVSGEFLFIVPPSTYTSPWIDSLYISSDKGSSWVTKKYPISFNNLTFWSGSDSSLFAFICDKQNKYGIGRSTDHGSTWDLIDSIPYYKNYSPIYISSDTVVLWGEYSNEPGQISYSIDHGITWQFNSTPGGYSEKPQLLNNWPKLVITYGSSAYTSSDLGASWQKKGLSPPGLLAHRVATYCMGTNWHVSSYKEKVKNTPVLYDYSFSQDDATTWGSSILIGAQAFRPVFFDKHIALGIGHGLSNVGDLTEGTKNFCYYSLDSGKIWHIITDPIYRPSGVVVGDGVIYAWGTTGLWRYTEKDLGVGRLRPGADSIELTMIPNPVLREGVVHFSYSLPLSSESELSIYDTKGMVIARIPLGTQEAGEHSVDWNSSSVTAGSYIVQLETNGKKVTLQLQIVK